MAGALKADVVGALNADVPGGLNADVPRGIPIWRFGLDIGST
jgi:hypothetical protein